MQEPMSEYPPRVSLYQMIQQEPSIKDLVEIDPKAGIFTQELNPADVQRLQKEYPDIFHEFNPNCKIFSVNVISSCFLNGQYRKIKLYYDERFRLLKKITA